MYTERESNVREKNRTMIKKINFVRKYIRILNISWLKHTYIFHIHTVHAPVKWGKKTMKKNDDDGKKTNASTEKMYVFENSLLWLLCAHTLHNSSTKFPVWATEKTGFFLFYFAVVFLFAQCSCALSTLDVLRAFIWIVKSDSGYSIVRVRDRLRHMLRYKRQLVDRTKQKKRAQLKISLSSRMNSCRKYDKNRNTQSTTFISVAWVSLLLLSSLLETILKHNMCTHQMNCWARSRSSKYVRNRKSTVCIRKKLFRPPLLSGVFKIIPLSRHFLFCRCCFKRKTATTTNMKQSGEKWKRNFSSDSIFIT